MAGNPLWDLLERTALWWDTTDGVAADVHDYLDDPLTTAGHEAPSLELLAAALAGYASAAPGLLTDRLGCHTAGGD